MYPSSSWFGFAKRVSCRSVWMARRGVLLLEDALAYRHLRNVERERLFGELIRSAAEAGEYNEGWVQLIRRRMP